MGDARTTLVQLREVLSGWAVETSYREEAGRLAQQWDSTVQQAYHLGNGPLPAQSEVIGAVNDVSEPRDIVICAAGSMPGDLHKLWRTRDPKGYHVEYGFSCMGYEIAGGLGAKMAAPDREVYVMVGDGSYLMMAQELVTAVQERVKLNVVLVNNHGFSSIGALSDTVGTERFGTWYRYRDERTGRLDGAPLPIDFTGNARSLGLTASRVRTIDELEGGAGRRQIGQWTCAGGNRNGPPGPRSFERILVGRAGGGGLHPGAGRAGPQVLRSEQTAAATVPLNFSLNNLNTRRQKPVEIAGPSQ